MMLTEPSLTPHLRTVCVLVVHLLLTDICRGQLIGASQPIIATLGDDVTLPCHLEPAEDVTEMTLEWSRPDLDPRFVYVWRSGEELVGTKHRTFEGRTTLFTEELQHGNISLRLSRVKLSDKGTYSCYIPTLKKQTYIQLVVGAVSPPVISLSDINGRTGGVVLQCESAGWYPQPEVLWLDGEGKLLSDGPTETVRGPDGLYTVSSRVTVEKRHSNKFTCRVQQNNINQSRETWFHVPDDLSILPSCSAAPIIVGLAVSLAVCIMLTSAAGFLLWRRNRIKTRRNRDKTETGEEKNCSETEEEKNCSETEEEALMSHEVVQMEVLLKKDLKNQQTVHDEDQMRKKTGEEEETQTEENNQLEENQTAGSQTTWYLVVEDSSAEVQKLRDEKKKSEDEKQQLLKKKVAKDVETQTEENNQLEENQTAAPAKSSWFSWSSLNRDQRLQAERQKEKAEKEVESLKKQVEDSSAEVQKLRDEKKKSEDEKQQLLKKLKDKEEEANMRWKEANKIFKDSENQLKIKNTEINELKRELEKQLWKEKQNAERVEKEQNELLKEIQEWQRKLQEETTRREKAEKEVETLKKQQKTKDGSRSEHLDYQMRSTQQNSSSSDHHPDLRDFILKDIDEHCKYVRLKNTSTEDKLLGGWKLQLQINDKKLFTYTFDQSFRVEAGEKITLWRPDCASNNPDTGNLVWKDLKTWSSEDLLRFILIDQNGDFKLLLLPH